MQERPSRGDFIGILATLAMSAACGTRANAASSKLVALAPGIAYVPGDIERSLTCNSGVITSSGQISIVDAAIPAGAAKAYAAIRAQTDLPIVRVFDTHNHLDHTYGNAYWSDHGAKPIAYAGLRGELAKAEPELFGVGPGLWQNVVREERNDLRFGERCDHYYPCGRWAYALGCRRLGAREARALHRRPGCQRTV